MVGKVVGGSGFLEGYFGDEGVEISEELWVSSGQQQPLWT